jgi:hypothetical protein
MGSRTELGQTYPLPVNKKKSRDREELERAARRSIEAQAGRPLIDDEWREARENLLALARLVVAWKLKPEFPVLASRLAPDNPPDQQRKHSRRSRVSDDVATAHDKDVIGRFLAAYNAEHRTGYQVIAWPDDDDRTGKAIDALAGDGNTTLAIEHTLLQPFAGEREDTAKFLQTVGVLDKAPHLMLSNLSVTLSFKVGAIPKGVNWSKITPAVEQWYLDVRDQLPNGSSRYALPNVPFDLHVSVERTPLKHDRGFFFIARVMPDRPLIETVRQALKTKVDKLTAAAADKRFLLLEKDIPIFGNGEVGELVEQLRQEFPKLGDVTEVWIADTGALQTENYFAIDLAWPLDAALERDEVRNEIT